MNDKQKLGKLLQAWKVNTSPPPRFSADVWTKINAREAERSWGFLGWLKALITPIPYWRLATATALVMAIAGIGLGALSAFSENERQRSDLAARYVQSIDPYLQARVAATP